MQPIVEDDILNYYHSYCELAIWFQKIIHAHVKEVITVKDVARMLILERNRIIAYLPAEKRKKFRREFNLIATSYYSKVSHWSKAQKSATDMV